MKRSGPRRGGLIGVVDIGSNKIACFIARNDEAGPSVLGIGHQLSRGVRHGVIVDLEAAGRAIATAVHSAEQMAGERVEQVVVGMSGGFGTSRIVPIEVDIAARTVGDADMKRVLALGYAHREPGDRRVIHSIPVGFSIDGSPGIRDPRGMMGARLGVNMHIVSASAAAVRNVIAALGRSHLDLLATVVSPYAAGLSALSPDELELGATVIDLGGGATSIAVFYDGAIVHADSIPVGGQNVTNDIARGLAAPIAAAERLKVLHGSTIPSPADEIETIKVPAVGEDESQFSVVPKSHLIGIVTPRIEETLELARDRLEAAGFDRLAGKQIVLTGGASQLTGVRELAAMILDKQVRLGRPRRVQGLAEATQGPAFAATAGLLVFASSEAIDWQPPGEQPDSEAGPSMFGRLGGWFRAS